MARPWTMPLLLHAAFILLSGASSEPRRCYWCGPLAEQVHRSQRSSACGASNHVTVCEPGYNYCAVVATSPPRVESRHCVKIYQDECYPLYCNSTKTWKMTCPCRGDLCNGPNTERELEAFALLPKLVAKTHNARIKKRTPNAAPHLIKHDSKIIANVNADIHNISNLKSDKINKLTNDNKLIVTESDGNLEQKSGDMQSDQPTNQPVVVERQNEENDQSSFANPKNIQMSSTVNNQLIEIIIHVSDPTEKTMKENEQPCTDSPTTTESNQASKNTEPVKEGEPMATTIQSMPSTEVPIKTTENMNTVESQTMKITENDQQSTLEIKFTEKPDAEPPANITVIMQNDSPIKITENNQMSATETKPTEKPLAGSPANITVIMQNDQPMDPMDEMLNDAPLISPTGTVHALKTTEESKMDEPPTKDPVKASDGVPTAEALQQNGSPSVSAAPAPVTEKSTELTTTESTTIPTVLTTQQQVSKTATTPAPRRKNSAVRITFSYMLLLMCVIYL